MSLIMKFNTIMLAVFVMIQVYETSGIVQGKFVDFRTKREADKSQASPHKFIKEDNMTKHIEAFEKSKKECGCVNPILQAVQLIKDDSTLEYIPRIGVVRRCGGSCRGDMICAPTSQTMKQIAVLKTTTSYKTEMGYVEIEEHTGCKCKCNMNANDCKGKQMYNSSACRCECPSTTEMMKCLHLGRSWDSTACMCMCERTEECGSCEKFDNETCKCKKVEDCNDIDDYYDY